MLSARLPTILKPTFPPGFQLTLIKDHHFIRAPNGKAYVEYKGQHQAQFHRQKGEGRFTLDPVSKITKDASARPFISN
jgi:hypothetical protein